MKNKLPLLFYILVVFCSIIVFYLLFEANASISQLQITSVPSFTAQMFGSTFAANGTLFAGDNNYNLYRSDNNGTSFRLIYQFPKQPNPTSAVTGYVLPIFVDSPDTLFVSVPGTNRLYRSTNFGSSFTQVLNTNGTQNDGFYIAMTQDSSGNLYTATYSNSISPLLPSVLKSADDGATWTIIQAFGSVHLHNVKFNPANGYLYVATSEWAQGYNNTQCERIFRSKDLGKTWGIVINRPAEIQGYGPTIYSLMMFNDNWVYLGTDQAYQVNRIDRFYDNGSNVAFTPQTVYTFPSDCDFPVISAVWLNKTMLFSSTAEFYSGTSRIVASDDGVNWQIIKATGISQSLHHSNVLSSNSKGMIFYSDGPEQTFAITQQIGPPPTPTPMPTVTPTPSPTPTAAPTPTPSPSPTPTPSPNPTPTPAPILIPTPTASPTSSPTPTPTPTSTPSPTDTQTPSPTPTDSPAPTPTPIPTLTPSPATTDSSSSKLPTPSLWPNSSPQASDIPPQSAKPTSTNDSSKPFSAPEFPRQALGITLILVLLLLTSTVIIARKRINQKSSPSTPNVHR